MSTLSGIGFITERALNFNEAGEMNEDDDLQFIEEVKVENLVTAEDETGCTKPVNLLFTQS
jgi:hypothetical protein